ncbi:pilin [Photobacterium damselae]|uniref:pilin n=1 Tax=Photobacterium damselae TaxID=38293 RepID=UPI001EDDE431|nr:pilin [Photobacterium damselae]MCG3846184.1 pilin [Photobacterium damselae]
MKGQKGFTLIELMIVVAVIGVLSAIAIPQYQKYVAKAEAASALATLTGLKTNAEAYTIENGTFPDGESVNGILGAPSTALGTITFTADVSDSKAQPTGKITFAFAKANVSPLNSGNTLSLERKSDGGWTCSSSSKDTGIIPKGCTTKAE